MALTFVGMYIKLTKLANYQWPYQAKYYAELMSWNTHPQVYMDVYNVAEKQCSVLYQLWKRDAKVVQWNNLIN